MATECWLMKVSGSYKYKFKISEFKHMHRLYLNYTKSINLPKD